MNTEQNQDDQPEVEHQDQPAPPLAEDKGMSRRTKRAIVAVIAVIVIVIGAWAAWTLIKNNLVSEEDHGTKGMAATSAAPPASSREAATTTIRAYVAGPYKDACRVAADVETCNDVAEMGGPSAPGLSKPATITKTVRLAGADNTEAAVPTRSPDVDVMLVEAQAKGQAQPQYWAVLVRVTDSKVLTASQLDSAQRSQPLDQVGRQLLATEEAGTS